MRYPAAIGLAALLWFGWPNRSEGGSRVLATTAEGPGADAGSPAAPDGIAARVIADERRAARIVAELIDSPDRRIAARAAVYASGLGLRVDDRARFEALAWGAGAETDPLFRALCWRSLASSPPSGELPAWRPEKPSEPVVEIMAALAYAARGEVPPALVPALGLPSGEPRGPDRRAEARELVARILPLTAPFDRGALALALAFVEARRAGWAEQDRSGRSDWSARRLRDDLARLVLGKVPAALARVAQCGGPGNAPRTALLETLTNPIFSRPAAVLRNAALAGPEALRIDALRAIAAVSGEPAAGDLGAAAAGLEAPGAALRLEAARTFLLLTRRARQ